MRGIVTSPRQELRRIWPAVRLHSPPSPIPESKPPTLTSFTYAPCVAAVLDQTAQTLFLTEMMRGLSLTLRAFFDKKVTVSFVSEVVRLA